jgi:hypothetical protein
MAILLGKITFFGKIATFSGILFGKIDIGYRGGYRYTVGPGKLGILWRLGYYRGDIREVLLCDITLGRDSGPRKVGILWRLGYCRGGWI